MIHVILVLFHLLFLRPHYWRLHFTRFVGAVLESLHCLLHRLILAR